MGDRHAGGLRRSQSLVSGLLSWMSPFRSSTSNSDTSMEEAFADAAGVDSPSTSLPPPRPAAEAPTDALAAPKDTSIVSPAAQSSPYARRTWTSAAPAPAFHPGSFETPTKRTSAALKTTSPFAPPVSPGRKHAPIYLGPGTSTRRTYSPLRSSLASTHSMSALAQQRPPILAREPAGTPEKRLKTSTSSTKGWEQVAFASPSTLALSPSTPGRKRPVDQEDAVEPDESTTSPVEVPVRRSTRHTRAASTMREVLHSIQPLEPSPPAVPEVVNPYQTRSQSAAPRTTLRSTRARALEAARQRALSEAPAADEPPKTSLLDMVERTEPSPVSPRRAPRVSMTDAPRSPEGKSSVEGALRVMANKPKRPSPLSMGTTHNDAPDAPSVTPTPAPSVAAPPTTTAPPALPADVPSWCIVTAPAQRPKPSVSGDQAQALQVPWAELPVFSFDITAVRARAALPTTAAPPAQHAPPLATAQADTPPTASSTSDVPASSESAAPPPEPEAADDAAAPAQANALTACGQGEEDEATSHEVRAKIWRLDAGAWQDLGVSIVRIKTARDTHKSRLLARNAVNGHVVLNFVLYEGLHVVCDKNVLTFLGFMDAKPCHLRCKVKTPEAAARLKEALLQYAQAE
ncbi:hypothetical protein MNAN1_003126 [Malassezia nana]|uniref:RanBD1 domain-containing protein n=1 Tax=Malassezia nana TaxID=180528 RepID=A0AAF0J8K4_9BASI|nr:hypothetical protein MNAN1_003126 [Malassezia nana]